MARKSVAIYFFLIGLFIVSACKCYAYDANQVLQVADGYLKKGLYLEAIGAYQDIADNSDVYEMQAKSILRIGDIYSYFLDNYDLALKKYSSVKEKYSSSKYVGNAYFNSGMILYEKGSYKKALEQFKMYLARHPRGMRRGTAEFMVEACSKPPSTIKRRDKDVASKVPADEVIRVLIIEGENKISIGCSDSFVVKDLEEKNTLFRSSGQTAVIGIHGKAVNINNSTSSHDMMVVLPSGKGMLKINGKSYRGKVRIRTNADGGMDVINVLGLEKYLYGVVPKEMPSRWSLEALKAQATVARSYALYQKSKSKSRDYDVYSTTYSQVYGGYGVESERSNRAVDETKGRVLLYDGRLVLAYFHSNSGGRTEDARNVWTADIPYLKGVPDNYSTITPNYLWSLSLSLEEIRRALNKQGVGVGDICEVIPIRASPSGRVVKVRILHSGGETVLTGNNFRIKIDPTVIKSTYFTMNKNGGKIRFQGKGYGHGVGLSQWGAYAMAKEGYSCSDILKHYYTGVEIR